MASLSTSPPRTPPARARPGFTEWTRDVLLLGVPESSSVPVRVPIVATAVVGAAAVAVSGAIHLHLWTVGYRHVPRIGPLFLAQSLSGFVIALAIVLFRRMFAVLAGAAFQAASVIGLVLSATVGFLGIHDGLGVPWATPSIVIELFGLVVLTVCAVMLAACRPGSGDKAPGGAPTWAVDQEHP